MSNDLKVFDNTVIGSGMRANFTALDLFNYIKAKAVSDATTPTEGGPAPAHSVAENLSDADLAAIAKRASLFLPPSAPAPVDLQALAKEVASVLVKEAAAAGTGNPST